MDSKTGNNGGCGGSLGNGYGIMVYPNPPNYYSNLKIFVAPYKQYVGGVGVRSFTSWTPSTEITWNNGNVNNTCNGPVAGLLGKFTVSITP